MQLGRLNGFKSALAASGIPLDDAMVRNVSDTVAGGHEATDSLLEQHPDITAIFCTNDLMAYGASQALADRGIRIPQDISLVGVTDIQLARDMRPALTTVALGIEQVATISINLLLDLIEDPQHEPTIVHVPDPVLVVRASTGPVRSGA
jgi:LacI family repressor for deo operon, udp, cdd, tsx, nupC, and nupG